MAPTQYRQLNNDYGPPSLGYTQGTGNSWVPQSKYAELLAIQELGEEIRSTYAGSKSTTERLKREHHSRSRISPRMPGRDRTKYKMLASHLTSKVFHFFVKKKE